MPSQFRSFGISNSITMRTLHRYGLADTLHKWHEDGHMDM
jgi:hypothetical protein